MRDTHYTADDFHSHPTIPGQTGAKAIFASVWPAFLLP